MEELDDLSSCTKPIADGVARFAHPLGFEVTIRLLDACKLREIQDACTEVEAKIDEKTAEFRRETHTNYLKQTVLVAIASIVDWQGLTVARLKRLVPGVEFTGDMPDERVVPCTKKNIEWIVSMSVATHGSFELWLQKYAFNFQAHKSERLKAEMANLR